MFSNRLYPHVNYLHAEFCVSMKEHCCAELNANFFFCSTDHFYGRAFPFNYTLFSELIGFYHLVHFC